MDIYFSDFFRVSPDLLEEHGAFDISLVNDLPLFIDPFLLFNSDNPSYQELHEGLIRYMRFLKSVSGDPSIKPPLLEAWFTFPEIKQNWLGYSQKGNRGHGLGLDFAYALHRNLHTVFRDFGEETITRSSHLEKLCLIRDGVGRDNISDFTTNLIAAFLAEYTQTFACQHIANGLRRRVPVLKAEFNYHTRSWVNRSYELLFFEGDYILLTPKDILTKDETWINHPELLDRFTEIADSLPNPVLRAQVNEYLLRVLPDEPKASKEEIHKAVSHIIEKFPQVLDYYIREKEDHSSEAISLSKARVAEVEKRFVWKVRQLVAEYLEPGGFYRVGGNTYDEARERVEHAYPRGLVCNLSAGGSLSHFAEAGFPLYAQAWQLAQYGGNRVRGGVDPMSGPTIGRPGEGPPRDRRLGNPTQCGQGHRRLALYHDKGTT